MSQIPAAGAPLDTGSLRLKGVDHLAHVTWKPEETLHFYRDVLGLPLVHAITATGWVTEDFPDFVHFFFALGKGNHLAFFYYFGLPEEEDPGDLMHRSRHLALHVDTEEELTAWRVRLKEHGVRVTPPLAHELLESLYFDDPNGIQLEITRPLRAFAEVDARDAELTLRALSDIAQGERPTVEDMWRRKGELARDHAEQAAGAAKEKVSIR
uniref:VOC family protein n=1 Tax=Streptomyces sp. NBC_00003 TaxID=2903608 RepID=A0AAU2V0S8_9ACTN